MSIDTLNKADISLKYGKLQSIIDWCETHCVGNWHFDVNDQETTYQTFVDPSWTFSFEDEQDYLLFVLTWM